MALKNPQNMIERDAYEKLSRHVQEEIKSSPLNISAAFILAAQSRDGISDDAVIFEIRRRNDLDKMSKDFQKSVREILVEENIARNDFSPAGTSAIRPKRRARH